MAVATQIAPDPAKVQETAGKFVADFAAAAGVQLLVLGIHTGVWKAMAGAGPLTAADLARRVGTADAYAREWLNAEAAGGYVQHDAASNTYTLPDEVAALVADDVQSQFLEGFGEALRAMSIDFPRFEERFRAGKGFAWGERSPGHLDAWDQVTQAMVVPELIEHWLPAIDGLGAALTRGGKVADVGTGYGAPLIAIAGAYPAAYCYGFDTHGPSLAHARDAAAAAGAGDRVWFDVASTKDFPGNDYDLITLIDTLHDLGDPVGALRWAHSALAPGGVVLLVEPAGGDTLEENLNTVGRLYYAASTLICTANGLAQEGHPLGTVPGEKRLRSVAREAGFTRIARLPVEAPFNILLELRR